MFLSTSAAKRQDSISDSVKLTQIASDSTSLQYCSVLNLRKVTIYLLTSCNTEERIVQKIYIHNSNKNYKKINYNNNINQKTDRHRL